MIVRDNAMDDGEAKARTFIERAAEGLKELVELGGRNAAALVRDGDGRVLDAAVLFDVGRHQQPAALRHRAQPIGRQVPQNLSNLVFVCVEPDRFRRHLRQQGAHLQHLVDGADALGSLLANALQAYLAEVSVRQNTDMRRISAWAAIWAVPTLLAGIYGMNFRHMPELSWRFGYPLVLVVMVAICLVLYRAFRHYGWL